MAAFVPILPLELVTEILLRLPVKSLLRFRCICRDWLNVIDSKNFMNIHLSHNTMNSCLIARDLAKCLHSVDLNSLEETVELDVGSWWPGDFWCKHRGARLWGSCNGLLCLSSLWKNVALWNPSTKKHLLLPLLSFDDDFQWEDYDSYFDGTLGFGFDSATDDYKVVSIIRHYTFDMRIIDTEVKVCSLRSNSWRRVYGFPEGSRGECDGVGVVVRDSIHWLAYFDLEESSSIVAFDLKTEELQQFSLPSSMEGLCFGEINIQVIKECISTSFFHSDTGFELWMMDEYGVQESWTKLISIGGPSLLPYYQVYPIQYCRNERMLLIARSNGFPTKVVWHDLLTKANEEMPNRGLPFDFFQKFLISESLVPLYGGSHWTDE